MKEVNSQNEEIPTNHGATLVANTAFATVFIIALIVLVPALWFGVHPIVIQALSSGILGAVLGFLLWRRGHIVLATCLHAGGLVVTGTLTFLGTQSLGGSAGILLLASVITAGGFLGLKGAVVDTIVVLLAGLSIIFFGDDIRPYFDMGPEPYIPPEYLVDLFVFFSIPAWGGYVVAIDRSNRKAWHTAVENKDRLVNVNTQLLASQRQQAKIAELGLLALQDISVVELEQMCQQVFYGFVPNAEQFWPMSRTLTIDELQTISSKVSIEYATFVDGLIQIVTTRRLREELLQERARLAAELQKEQRLESLSRMAGGVAHDFNNALMVVTGVAEDMLHHVDHNERSKRGVETILTVSRHISDMTNQLLLFARGLPLKETAVDVASVVLSMADVLERVVPSNVVLTLDAEPSGFRVVLPSDQIERVVLNLVRNSAMAFDPDGDGEIQVAVCPPVEQHICIRVSDNGIGMDPDTLERAIEPYFSIRGSTGLGLSTVHGLIQQAGGRLEIESNQGEGTAVAVWLPTVQSIVDGTLVDASTVSNQRRMALLIDDEPLVRQSVRLLLERLGWTVASCENRTEAMEVLHRRLQDVEVVVCDIRLGNDNGFDLVDALQEQGLNVPVLYITGYASSLEQHLEANENLLVKPFQSEQLAVALQTLLEKSPR